MKNKTKVLLTSMLTIAMTASLAVGGTYALFTSEDEVNIAVTSGKVEVTATIEDVTLYSMGVATTDAWTFENGGTATLDDEKKNLTLTNVTPGDKAVVDLKFTNKSNVAIQYRIGASIVGDLADALTVSEVVGGVEEKYEMKYSKWATLAAGATLEEDTAIAIELPVDYEDQVDGITNISFFVEAVQGNAPVANVGLDNTIAYETTVEDANKNSATAPKGVKMKDGATTMTLNVSEAKDAEGNFTTNTGNFTLGTNAAYAYEIKIPEVAADNDTEITVKVKVPANLENVYMFHEGVAMNSVASADLVVNHNDFYYTPSVTDSKTNEVYGVITLATKNFSNFTIVNKLEGVVFVSTADQLIAALEGDATEIAMTNNIKIDPANMSNAYGTTGINICNNETLNGRGYTLDIKGAGGTWDSGINITGGTIKNITVTGSFRGIFINHNSDVFGKVILENVITTDTVYTISCDQGTNSGLEATNCQFYGWTSFAATLGDAVFTNCTFGEGRGYAYCRPYAPTSFINCTFEEGYQMDACAEVVFYGCNINGVEIIDDNLATLVTSNIANASVGTIVNSGEEIQDAINNGEEEIILGGDIDLSNGLIIP